MIRSLVVARARNRVIGHANGMPWKLPADLAYFKHLTMGHPVIMGRLTYESIGKPLPGRNNIVVTRNPGFEAPGCTIVKTLEDAFVAAGHVDEVFVIGGAQIYEAALPTADRIYLTEVEAEVAGDTHFPALEFNAWIETEIGRKPIDERNAYSLRFVRLDRRPGIA